MTAPDPFAELPPDALDPEPGWSSEWEWPFPTGKPGRFVSGDETGTRYQLRYYRDADDSERVHAKVWFGPGAEGPPQHAHGGSQAAFLDEVAGMAAWCAGIPVVAATLTTHFKRMLPLGKVVEAESHIVSRKDRRVTIDARIFAGDVVYATAEGLFMVISDDMGRRLDKAAKARDGEPKDMSFRSSGS
jgi:acyl-coenzyme A thioesterase PaaI-like protein